MSGLADDGEPGTEDLAGLSKVVFSSTLSEPLAWPNTELVAHDAVQTVKRMKADSSASSMRTMGSLTLCRSLLKAGLVDRFRVVVFPVITGSTGQDRIYNGYPDVGLEMINSRSFRPTLDRHGKRSQHFHVNVGRASARTGITDR